MKRIIVGISGASGALLGQWVLKALKFQGEYEVHLVVTPGGLRTWELEVGKPLAELERYADVIHDPRNLAAAISSGSYRTEGMIVAPCSMKTLAAVSSGYTDNLLTRAVDVCLKENRRVVLLPREMPLNQVHLRNMTEAARLGAVIIPPMLTFYNESNSVEQQLDHIVGKVLAQFGLEIPQFRPWKGVDNNA